MKISKVKIEKFKCYKGEFILKLSKGLNIIVGNNETGKSTILESVHLALTGLLNGRDIKNALTHDWSDEARSSDGDKVYYWLDF